MNTPAIETDRLILRKFTEADLHALYAIYSDEEVNTFLPWYPLKDMEETRKFYEEQWQPKNFPVIFRMYQLNFNGNDSRVYKEYWNCCENHFIEEF